IQLFALTLYTDACTPWALCSANNRRCSPPTLISAHTPSINIGGFRYAGNLARSLLLACLLLQFCPPRLLSLPYLSSGGSGHRVPLAVWGRRRIGPIQFLQDRNRFVQLHEFLLCLCSLTFH